MKGTEVADFLAKFDKNALENLFLQVETAVTKNAAEKEGILQEAFREIHSLKGTASFAHIESLTDLLHSMEDALGVISRNSHQIRAVKDTKVFDIFFSGLDVVEELSAKLSDRPYFDVRESPEMLRRYMRIVANSKALLGDPGRYFEMTELNTDLF